MSLTSDQVRVVHLIVLLVCLSVVRLGHHELDSDSDVFGFSRNMPSASCVKHRRPLKVLNFTKGVNALHRQIACYQVRGNKVSGYHSMDAYILIAYWLDGAPYRPTLTTTPPANHDSLRHRSGGRLLCGAEISAIT